MARDREKYNKAKREWYHRNKEKHLVSHRAKKKRLKEYISSLKNVPCTDCGIKYPPYIMDFDHLPKYEKKYNVGTLSSYSVRVIDEEVKKCEVVCANCHRERTHKRRLHLISSMEEQVVSTD